MNNQHAHNALTNQKSSAAYFKDVKTEEVFSNQDQKVVETNNLWRQLSSDKIHYSANPLLQRLLTQKNWWLEQQKTHQDFLISHTLSWKIKKKIVPQKIASRTNTKNIVQKHKDQNRKLITTTNCQQTHNALTTQKMSLCISKMSKLKKKSVAKIRKVETTTLWQLSSDKKSPQRKSASATIANPVELMIGKTRISSRLLN